MDAILCAMSWSVVVIIIVVVEAAVPDHEASSCNTVASPGPPAVICIFPTSAIAIFTQCLPACLPAVLSSDESQLELVSTIALS